MHVDPLLPSLVATLFVVVACGVLVRRLGQPFLIGCIVAGVLLGPRLLGVLDDVDAVARLGAIGVVFLLFFVGGETSPSAVARTWRVAAIGTAIQIAVSLGCVWAVGAFLDWPLARIVLLGFVISLSSTAVVMRLLHAAGESDSRVGRDVTAILLTQDVAIAPMLIVLGVLAGDELSSAQIGVQVAGGALVTAALIWLARKGELGLPHFAWLTREGETELRVFAALLPCLGLALATGYMGLSTGLGAFLGGMLLAATRETRWASDSLRPFEVVFVGLFFVSVGMLVDPVFLLQHSGVVLALVAVVLVTNTFINAVALRVLGSGWGDALYAGALLAQIGEFSFVLAAVGLQAGLISEYGYQTTVATIAVSMVASPPWIASIRRLARRPRRARPAAGHAS